MVGFGHIRRNASIAYALRNSALQPSILMIAEAWQAGGLVLPSGVDCVTLPALRQEPDGGYNPRFLPDISDEEIIALRTRVIRGALEVFEPDVLIVDCLPLGVAGELGPAIECLRRGMGTRFALGLRDVLYDNETVKRTWANRDNLDAIRNFYDAVWIYGDPNVFDPVREYDLVEPVAEKAHYTGYLDQRPRLDFAKASAGPLMAQVPPGKLVLCVVGGGYDGLALAEAFLETDLPPGRIGLLLTGPLMPWEERKRIRRKAQWHPRIQVLDFVPDPTPLMERADRIISMGGYNTVCEELSLEKHALIVPRVNPEPEQWIRAERLHDLGLVEMLHPDELSGRALTNWIARDLGPPPDARSRIDLDGLTRIPALAAELLGPATSEGSPVP
jgi:predicted glycosyltransferase